MSAEDAARGKRAAKRPAAPDSRHRRKTPEMDRRLRLVVENAFDFAIVTTDTEGRLDTWNVGAERLLGYTEQEAIGQHISLLFTPEDRAQGIPEAEMRTARQTGHAEDERLHQRKDGSRFYATGVLTALRAEGGQFEGYAKILRDLTARKQTEEALRAAEARYGALFSSIDEGFCIVEVVFDDQEKPVDYRFLEVNPAFEKQTGLHAATGRRMRELAPDLEEHWYETYGRVALTGKSERFEARAEALGRWFDVFAFRLGDPAARRVAILFTDISERKTSEAETSALKAGLAADLAAMSRLHTLSTRLVLAAGDGDAALGDVLEEVLDATIGLQGADFGSLQLYDREAKRLFIAAYRGFGQAFLDHFAKGVSAENTETPYGRALARRRRVFIEDVHAAEPEYAPLRAVADAAGYRAVQSTPLFSRDGEPLGMLSTYFRRPQHRPAERELTLTDLYARLAAELIERKQDEQALRDSEARLRLAMEATGIGIWEWDFASDHIHWSRAAASITGLPPESSADRDALRRLVHPDDIGIVQDAEEAVRTGGTFQAEYRLLRPDGQVCWVSNHARVHRDAAGNPVRMLGTLSDITERKRRERNAAFLTALSDTLRPLSDAIAIQTEAARLLGQHLSASRVTYVEVEPDGSAVIAGNDYTDSSVASLVGRYRIEEYHPALLTAFRAGRTVVTADVASESALSETQREALARLSIGAHITVPLVKGDRLVALLGIHQATPREWRPDEVLMAEEVTERTWAAVERARAEEALRQSEARLAAIFAQAEVGICELTLDGRFLRVNDALCQILGRSREELLARGVPDVTYPEDLPTSLSALKRLIEEGEPISLDKRYLRPDGMVVWANSSVTRLDDEQGHPRTLLVATVDMTERKRAEDALRQTNDLLEERVAERTRALTERTRELARTNDLRQELLRQLVTAQEEERGRISRELHDELGQYVTALLLGLGSLKEESPSAPEIVARLQAITGELAERAHRLSFALRPTALDDLGLVAALTNYAEEWQHWSGDIPVDLAAFGVGNGATRLPPEVESTIYRVVQEALNNVLRHAVRPGGGRGRGGADGATCVSVLVHRLPGGTEVVATVEDDGPGFDAEAAMRLAPENRRLGLLGMRERAALVGGTLTIESAPHQGTTVFLRIPLSPPPGRKSSGT